MIHILNDGWLAQVSGAILAVRRAPCGPVVGFVFNKTYGGTMEKTWDLPSDKLT